MKIFSTIINQLYPILVACTALGGMLIILTACSSSAEYSSAKMDASLHQRISNPDNDNSDKLIQFTGKTNKEVNEQMKDELQNVGINIETVIGDIFTASGTQSSIKKASLLDFVVYLELVKKLDIK